MTLGFLCYARWDESQKNERLNKLRELLEGEVFSQSGAVFTIFQDQGIHPGENWRETIDKNLEKATYLIPILTPEFFGSVECRYELESFLKSADRQQGNKLILPILYEKCPKFPSAASCGTDDLAQRICRLQCVNWTEITEGPSDSGQIEKKIRELGCEISDHITRSGEDFYRFRLAMSWKTLGTMMVMAVVYLLCVLIEIGWVAGSEILAFCPAVAFFRLVPIPIAAGALALSFPALALRTARPVLRVCLLLMLPVGACVAAYVTATEKMHSFTEHLPMASEVRNPVLRGHMLAVQEGLRKLAFPETDQPPSSNPRDYDAWNSKVSAELVSRVPDLPVDQGAAIWSNRTFWRDSSTSARISAVLDAGIALCGGLMLWMTLVLYVVPLSKRWRQDIVGVLSFVGLVFAVWLPLRRFTTWYLFAGTPPPHSLDWPVPSVLLFALSCVLIKSLQSPREWRAVLVALMAMILVAGVGYLTLTNPPWIESVGKSLTRIRAHDLLILYFPMGLVCVGIASWLTARQWHRSPSM